MATDQRLHDLFDGDPGVDQLEYHQDYREDGIWQSYFARPQVLFPTLLVFGAFVYHVLRLLDFDLLPLSELVWNCVVYLTPYSLIDAVENYQSPLRIADPAVAGAPRTHAEKSNAMRRIFGLDTGGIIGSVAQAGRRRFSTLPGMKIGAGSMDGRPAGLGNWDNSCYQNSVLQGLASLGSLSEYLTVPSSEVAVLDDDQIPPTKMADALHGLIGTLNDASNNGKRIWTPATLKSMSSWQQQDAQEYFSKVLDEVDKEIGKVVSATRRSQGFETDGTSSSSSASSEPLQVSAIRNPLEGLIAQRVGCLSCGYAEGLSMIPFNCLTVPLGGAMGYHVEECLDEYTKLEFIEGVECGKCTLLKKQSDLETLMEQVKDAPETDFVRKSAIERLAVVSEALEDDDYEDKTLLQKCKIPAKNRVTSTKSRQAVVARPPKSLVVHFNRSLFDEMTGELRKNYADVRFPKVLDLGPWCLGSSGVTGDPLREEWLLRPNKSMIATGRKPSRVRGPLYELRAVVTHYGRHENGHYICYRKHPVPDPDEKGDAMKDQWWRLSDDDVMKVSEETVLGQGGVFMLFFDNVEPGRLLQAETLPVESTTAQQLSTESELELATSIPLPDVDDSDFSEGDDGESSLATYGESAATSVSEYDDDIEDYDRTEHKPTQAILVPSGIQKTGVHGKGNGTGQTGTTFSANMLMV